VELTQPDLWGSTATACRPRIPYRGEAPHNRTATSEAAAREIEPQKGSLQYRVWQYIRSFGRWGATAQEIEHGLNLSGNTVRPRLRELEEMQLIQKTKRTRRTTSGRSAFVYVAN